MFHQPLIITNRRSQSQLKPNQRIESVADTYQSFHIVAVPIKNYMLVNVLPDIAQLVKKEPEDFNCIAISLKSVWLYKEVICRLISDPTKNDDKIMDMFASSGVAPLIIKKRGLLRASTVHVLTSVPNFLISRLTNNDEGWTLTKDISTAYKFLSELAAETVAPLSATVISKPTVKEDVKSKTADTAEHADRGLTCMDITDDDLP